MPCRTDQNSNIGRCFFCASHLLLLLQNSSPSMEFRLSINYFDAHREKTTEPNAVVDCKHIRNGRLFKIEAKIHFFKLAKFIKSKIKPVVSFTDEMSEKKIVYKSFLTVYLRIISSRWTFYQALLYTPNFFHVSFCAAHKFADWNWICNSDLVSIIFYFDHSVIDFRWME